MGSCPIVKKIAIGVEGVQLPNYQSKTTGAQKQTTFAPSPAEMPNDCQQNSLNSFHLAASVKLQCKKAVPVAPRAPGAPPQLAIGQKSRKENRVENWEILASNNQRLAKSRKFQSSLEYTCTLIPTTIDWLIPNATHVPQNLINIETQSNWNSKLAVLETGTLSQEVVIGLLISFINDKRVMQPGSQVQDNPDISNSLLLNATPLAESEHVFCNGTMGHEPDSRPVEYHDNALDSTGNGIVKENENGKFCDLKAMEVDADRLPNVAPVQSPRSSLKMKPFEDSVFYMDKSVMECEVPELIVCYKENTYHVKDICVDEGVPLQDKFLFDTDTHEKNVCEFLPSARDMSNEMIKEKSALDMLTQDVQKSSSEKQNVNLHLPVPGMLKSSEEMGSKYESSLDCDPKHLVQTEEVMDYVTKKVANDASNKILSLRDLLSMPELGANFTPTRASNHSMDKVEQQSLQCPRENAILDKDSASEECENGSEETISVSSTLVSAAQESDTGCKAATLAISAQDTAYQVADHSHKEAAIVSSTLTCPAEESNSSSKESKLAGHAFDSISEESTSRILEDLPYDSKKVAQSITFDDDSSDPTACGRESPQHSDSQHLGTRILPRLEDPNTELYSGQLYADGESSFSAAVPLSGLISYSGHIANSGSVSLRSDSSTASTRSFAFPV
ncbi:unnamed protein product [Dovyalis caffra]|uniref:Uncharacterized protein n=1 Tax=Dovyalis caffra TaxID=77055 RepID=A0AAV1QZC0_9ROSI|nr:unnamed protein product [Dovyalis caffra]